MNYLKHIFALLALCTAVTFARQIVKHEPLEVPPTEPIASGENDGCVLNVNTAFGKLSPIPLHNLTIVSPDGHGDLRLATGSSLQLYCSDNIDTTDQQLLTVHCLHDQTVRVLDTNTGTARTSAVSALSCSAQIKASLVVDRQVGNLAFARIGFTVPTGSLVGLIDLAYDTAAQRSVYAHHQIGEGIAQAQLPDARLAFRKDGLFVGDNHLYERESQRKTICDQLLRVSRASCDRYFGNAQKYLARGHLAPSGDFEYRAEQRSTFTLANVAPQWQSINNGHWKAVEAGVRKLAVQQRLRLDILTGTMGTLRLPNADGDLVAVSLEAGGQIPVPEWFYKVIVDGQHGRGVVLIVSNNPTLSAEEATKEGGRVCKDVSDRLKWAEFLREANGVHHLEKGYTYACEVADFVGGAGVEVPAFVKEKYSLLA